jgi:hypothetical protein
VQAAGRHHDRAVVRSDRRRRTGERPEVQQGPEQGRQAGEGRHQGHAQDAASYYKSIANNDTQAIQDKAQDFAQASTKYANYIVTNCLTENLPGGVTIPKIPGE